MRLNKYHFQVLIVEAVLVILAGLVVLIYAWVKARAQEARAGAFLQEITKVEVGRSTFEEAKIIARKYDGIPWWVNNNSMRCNYEACRFRFVFENKPLTSLRVVPWTAVIAEISVRNGTITSQEINYVRGANRPLYYTVRESAPPASDTEEPQARSGMIGLNRLKVDKQGIPSVLVVELHPSNSPDQRRRAYALNLSCLSALFGCNSPSAIFPIGIPYRGGPYQTLNDPW